MARTLIVYGTTEGQTAKVAHFIADIGRHAGHMVDVVHAAEIAEDTKLENYAAALVGASVHEGRYQRDVRRFIERHRMWLGERPSGFFSVSMAAASSHPEEVLEIQKIIDDFVAAAGWKPSMTASFAGALKYTQYNWLKRALMKHIAKKEGGATDTAHDYEYTNWTQVRNFGERFFALV
jgi:menaquinone-dependent protoporphyrinogen oxidase